MREPRPIGSSALRGTLPGPRPELPEVAFHLGLLAVLVALELFARITRTDAEDAVGVAVLALLFELVRRRHARRPLAWVDALEAAWRRASAAFRRENESFGIDLRGTPRLPRIFPPLLGSAAVALTALCVVLVVDPGFEPLGLREAIRSASGLAWLLLLGGSWVLLGAGAYYLSFLTFALHHDEVVRAREGPGPHPGGGEALRHAGWAAAGLAAWLLLPPWGPLLFLGACLLVAFLALGLPGGPDATLLWRPPGGGGRVAAVSWKGYNLAGTALLGLPPAAAILFLRAGDLRGGDEKVLVAALPLSTLTASLFGWAGAAALMAWSRLAVRTALLARFRDPARGFPVPVSVADPLPPGERRRVADALTGCGFDVRFAPGPPGPVDVPVTLDPDRASGQGALLLPRGELAAPESRRRIARRHEIRCRRALVRGLQGLFRRAAARTFRRGIGFWVAPWHWFCIGLSRDEDERSVDWKEGTFFLETIGPSYHRAFPREALAHAHRVMRDLQVDLVFVEDGVGFRRFRRVLRMAFEVHDMLGSRGRAEERHFTGLPGVRVILHEFSMEEPFRPKRGAYPEPDYDSVGRARILHVFRDRGEEEVPADAPRDRRGVPVPA